MKKVLSLIIALVMLLALTVSISSCNFIFPDIGGGDNITPTPEHTHSLSLVKEKAASCTEDGVIAHYTCSGCDKLFSDAEGKNEITDVVAKATGHTEVVDKGIKPTCTKTGLSDGRHCSVCGTVTVSRETLDSLGHDWEDSLTEDETGSYYKCKNGCGEKRMNLSSTELTLMSFNIRLNNSGDGNNAWPNRKANVINYINSTDFDVMCLQEVVTSQYNDIKAGLASKYTIIHYERQGAGSEGLAIIYNNETFNLIEQSRFWLSATPEIQSLGWGASYYRICVNLLLEHKETGAKIDVYNVHLDHQVETARINGINLILERAARKGYPLVLAGDFNCYNTSETHATANATLKDCQEEAPITETGITHQGFNRVENTDEGDAIDFIFVDEANMTPLTFEIIDEYPSDTEFYSDHFAIKSKVILSVNETTTKAYVKQEYSSEINNDFVSDKENALDIVYGSGNGWAVTTNGVLKENNGSAAGGIGSLGEAGKYVDYTFYLAEDSTVDLIWSVAPNYYLNSTNNTIKNMAEHMVITIDGIPIDVSGLELPIGDGTNTSLWYNYSKLVIKDLELEAGVHHFTCHVVVAGGVNVEKLTVMSDSEAIVRDSTVTGADIYAEGDKLYYTLTFENNGFTAEDYVFFHDGGIVVKPMKAEEKDGYITFTFDFTDREVGSRFNPHALVGGRVYLNGANTNGDVRGSKLVFTAKTIELGGKSYELFSNYSMPSVDISAVAE